MSEKLLGINIDNFFTFNERVSKLWKKPSQKLHVIARISSYLNKNNRLTMNAFFFVPVWILSTCLVFHNRKYNNKINWLHERMLRIVYKDHKSSFAELLPEDKSFTAHHKSVQKLAIEVYKVKNELCLKIILDLSIIPDEMRESSSLKTFCQKFKLWKPNSCPCRICKKYIVNVGFVNLS